MNANSKKGATPESPETVDEDEKGFSEPNATAENETMYVLDIEQMAEKHKYECHFCEEYGQESLLKGPVMGNPQTKPRYMSILA